MNLFNNLLKVFDCHTIEDSYHLAMNILEQNNPKNDINELNFSVYYNELRTESLSQQILEYHSLLSVEQIKEIITHIKFDTLAPFFEISPLNIKSEIKNEPLRKIGHLIENKTITIKEDKTKEIGYSIFHYYRDNDFQEDKFNIVYEKFKKECVCNKKKLLSQHHSSFFLIQLLNTGREKLLNKIMNDFDISINDNVSGAPLYFHLTSSKMLQYIIDKGVNTSLKSTDDKNFTQYWLSKTNGSALMEKFNDMHKVDSEVMLNSYIELGKKKEEIVALMQSINPEFHKIKIKGVPVFNKMVQYNNMKMTTHLLQKYGFETILKENTGYSPLYYYFLNSQRLTKGVESQKNTLINKIFKDLDIAIISSREIKEIMLNLAHKSRYLPNPLMISPDNLPKDNYNYIEKIIPYENINKMVAYLMQGNIEYEDAREFFNIVVEKDKTDNAMKNIFYLSQLMKNSSQEDRNSIKADVMNYLGNQYLTLSNHASLWALLSIVDLQSNVYTENEVEVFNKLFKVCEKSFVNFGITEKLEKFQLSMQINQEYNKAKTLKI